MSIVGSATQAGLTVSSEKRAALARAIAELEPFSDDPRIEALTAKMNAIANPTEWSEQDGQVNSPRSSTPVTKADRLADRLVQVKKAEAQAIASGELQSHDLEARVKQADATRAAQAAYLREVSPGAAAAVEREREFERLRIAR